MDCLSRIDFPDWLLAETRVVGMPLDRLTLEITEGSLMQDAAKSLDVLSRLCLKRVRLSIDDYGTAYSNLEKLKMLPQRPSI
jgi:EAL domain-containing protein (putative c-di-GMP-specific phosphodiesterase class I)